MVFFDALFAKNVKEQTLINDLLNHLDIKVRIKSAKQLGKIKNAQVAKALLQSITNDYLYAFIALRDNTLLPSKNFRNQRMGRGEYMPLVTTVARALNNLGVIAEDSLIEALHDSSLRVRAVATRVLIGWSPKSRDALKMVYENPLEEVLIRFIAGKQLKLETENIFNQLLGEDASKSEKIDILVAYSQVYFFNFSSIEQI